MPRFNVEATFGLRTVIEPDFYSDSPGDADANDYADNSYFRAADVEVDGGNITFWVEAEDEHDAERQAEQVISDGSEVEDSNGLTWEVCDVSFSIEKDEMTRDEAFAIVRRLLDRLSAEGVITSEEREALDLVIQDA